jgi:hypothetical protein
MGQKSDGCHAVRQVLIGVDHATQDEPRDDLKEVRHQQGQHRRQVDPEQGADLQATWLDQATDLSCADVHGAKKVQKWIARILNPGCMDMIYVTVVAISGTNTQCLGITAIQVHCNCDTHKDLPGLLVVPLPQEVVHGKLDVTEPDPDQGHDQQILHMVRTTESDNTAKQRT